MIEIIDTKQEKVTDREAVEAANTIAYLTARYGRYAEDIFAI